MSSDWVFSGLKVFFSVVFVVQMLLVSYNFLAQTLEKEFGIGSMDDI